MLFRSVLAALGLALGCGLDLASAAEVANRAAGCAVARVGTAPVHWADLLEGLVASPHEKLLSRTHVAAVAGLIRGRYLGRTVLVVGHSNTVPAVVAELGGPVMPPLCEGEFANLTVEIRNPRIGLLSPGRKRWAWLSWNNGSEVIPLFFGRLVGVPGNLQQEIVTLQFTARPADYDARKQSLAETLKVAPYYDPVWIAADKRDDPDVVLEARSQIWHIDRVSHAVTVSDLLVGEDGLLEFLESAEIGRAHV